MNSEYLLVSDLDDTFLGDRAALHRFAEFYDGIRDCLQIAYASGRFYETIRQDVVATPLPEPVAVLGGVGSEIRDFPSGELDTDWVRQISTNWSASQVRQLLAADPTLRGTLQLQPEPYQSEFKISYYLDDATDEQLEHIRSLLAKQGIQVDLIYSSRQDLDVLPKGVNKGKAAAFIAERLGYPPERVMVSGNSGNDIRLFEHGFLGIVVANAHPVLKNNVDANAYLSSEARADGVRDGIQHWMLTSKA